MADDGSSSENARSSSGPQVRQIWSLERAPRTESLKRTDKLIKRINPQFAWAELRVNRSRIDRFGVFAAETIPRHSKVIQYTGERIGPRLADRRWARRLLAGKAQRIYTVQLNRQWVIDGSVGGSGAELINHSCDPNLTVHKRRGQVFLFSRKRILAGQELTVDYGFRCPPCHCGAKNCRGTMCQCGRRPTKP